MKHSVKKRVRYLTNCIEPVAGGGVCAITAILMLILTLTAFLFTTGMEIVEDGEGMDSTVNRIFELPESVVYYSDSFVENLVLFAVALVGCRLLLPAVMKLRFGHEAALLAFWITAAGVTWVLSSQVKPTYDSAYVAESALAFAQGDFSDMSGSYLREYPFQLGYIQFCELILRAVIRFCGVPETFLSLQIANVALLALADLGLLRLSSLLISDPRAQHLAFLLLMFCSQPVLSCSFTYGLVPGVCFAVWAIVFQTLWFQRGKAYYGAASALCVGLAVLLKSNNLIVLIAMVIVAGLRLFKRKQPVKDIAVILALCLCAFAAPRAVRALYERRSGVTLEPGMPYISWIAMGLSESRRAPGWYSNVTSNLKFEELDSDPEVMADYSKTVIRERIEFFRENPQYTRDFFYRKFVSQFNETTYQSLWNNEVRGQYEEKGAAAAWVCGDGEAYVRRYMDTFAQLVFVGMLAALFLMARRRDYTALILPLSVLGGMLFHLLSEGKSQYILPYFMLMIPAGAWGLSLCCDGLDRLADRLRTKRTKEAGPTAESPAD